ncbi:MAG: DNA repair protein RadA, partial [Chitinivibrionales bacterium]|nr:DNA repair protein RadA [Chitinivibrionales bacterium]
PTLVVIDSIQTLFSEQLESAPGSVSQVRECAAMLMRQAKSAAMALLCIGHITKEGAIAGPRVLEHMVDTVIYFEGDGNFQYRLLRATKNRFGPSGEIALLAMSDSGMSPLTQAAEFFLLHRTTPGIGTAVCGVREGSRILVVELQALVNRTHFGLPQRVASGINPKKLSLLVAVLERFAGVVLGDYDIFFNIAAGLSIAEPAIDVGSAAAILSSFRNCPLRKGLACIGEIGLGGELRPVNNMAQRLKELFSLGFTECIVSPPPAGSDWVPREGGISIIACPSIAKLQECLF